jgi:hypothetical protein
MINSFALAVVEVTAVAYDARVVPRWTTPWTIRHGAEVVTTSLKSRKGSKAPVRHPFVRRTSG